MQANQWLSEAFNHPVAPNNFSNCRAQQLAALASRDDFYGFALVHTASNDNNCEVVVVDVELSLGQKKLTHEIRSVERVAVLFFGDSLPAVIPLRDDFPDVSHQNTAPKGLPRSLCLYDEPWAEIKLQWTPFQFLERIRTWFEKTAYGELHADNQPLDPFFMGGSFFTLVIPPSMLSPGYAGEVVVTGVTNEDSSELLFLEDGQEHDQSRQKKTIAAILVTTEPTSVSRLNYSPTTLRDLVDVEENVGKQIIETLRNNIFDWIEKDQAQLEKALMIILNIPQLRENGSEVESFSTHAFIHKKTAGYVGQALGITEKLPGTVSGPWGRILGKTQSSDLSEFEIETGDVRMGFSPELAAVASAKEVSRQKVVLIGAGSLGSQLALVLSREGFGSWTIVDKDILLPHNLARHELHTPMLGHTKATSVAWLIKKLHAGEEKANGIVCDVLSPRENQTELTAAMSDADLIIDASASVAVARWLAHYPDRLSPVISLFLNPEGCDLVALYEGINRRCRIDCVEMDYLSGLTRHPDLSKHLAPPSNPILHSTSCREPSVQIPQSRITRLVGRAADIVRGCVDEEGSKVVIWHDAADKQCIFLQRDIPNISSASIYGWTIYCSSELLHTLADCQDDSLNIETGGVIAGMWDRENRTIYVTNCIGPPTDSVQEHNGFIRGTQGLEDKLAQLSKLSARNIGYVGEWHTHPKGNSSQLSNDDKTFLEIMNKITSLEGSPAIMMVAGDDGIRLALAEEDKVRAEDVLFEEAHFRK